MELKEFIKQSLVDIVEGVSEVQSEVESKNQNYPIVPVSVDGKTVYSKHKSEIIFDVSVNVTERGEINKGGEVKSSSFIEVLGLSANIGIEGRKENSSSKINRIQFCIPFYSQAVRKKTKK